jgi:hypothetical protein
MPDKTELRCSRTIDRPSWPSRRVDRGARASSGGRRCLQCRGAAQGTSTATTRGGAWPRPPPWVRACRSVCPKAAGPGMPATSVADAPAPTDRRNLLVARRASGDVGVRSVAQVCVDRSRRPRATGRTPPGADDDRPAAWRPHRPGHHDRVGAPGGAEPRHRRSVRRRPGCAGRRTGGAGRCAEVVRAGAPGGAGLGAPATTSTTIARRRNRAPSPPCGGRLGYRGGAPLGVERAANDRG